MKSRSTEKPATGKARPAEKNSGRATPKKRTNGRYTAPIPTTVKHSPRWYPWMILSLLFLGVITIILNYIGTLPKAPTNWYTLGALIGIVAGSLAATGYR